MESAYKIQEFPFYNRRNRQLILGLALIAGSVLLATVLISGASYAAAMVLGLHVAVYSLFVLAYLGKRHKEGRSLLLRPSLYLAIAPLLQSVIPAMLAMLDSITYLLVQDQLRLQLMGLLWTTYAIMFCLGAYWAEPKQQSARTIRSWVELHHKELLAMGFLLAFVAAIIRLSLGIRPEDWNVVSRVIDSYSDVASEDRLAVLVAPFAELGILCMFIGFAKTGLNWRKVFVVGLVMAFWISYYLVTGFRGGAVFVLLPSLLAYILLTSKPNRQVIIRIVILGALLVLIYIGGTSVRMAQETVARHYTDRANFLDALTSVFFATVTGDSSTNISLESQRNPFARTGVFYVMDRVVGQVGSGVPSIEPLSVVGIFTKALPQSIFPLNQFIPQALPGPGGNSLGYMMHYYVWGTFGKAMAVGVPVEVYWRFGPWLGLIGAFAFGAFVGLTLKIVARWYGWISALLVLVLSPLMLLLESYDVLVARFIRYPVYMLIAWVIARFVVSLLSRSRSK